MPGPLQGADEILIETSPHRIFAILEDARRLPDWTSVISTSGTRETVGAVRECEVDLDGKRGNVVERCIESDPPRRIAWAMEEDTFGFSRLVSDFGFSFNLEPAGDGKTRVRNETYYRSRGPLAAAMNTLLMRRKFRGTFVWLPIGSEEPIEVRPLRSERRFVALPATYRLALSSARDVRSPPWRTSSHFRPRPGPSRLLARGRGSRRPARTGWGRSRNSRRDLRGLATGHAIVLLAKGNTTVYARPGLVFRHVLDPVNSRSPRGVATGSPPSTTSLEQPQRSPPRQQNERALRLAEVNGQHPGDEREASFGGDLPGYDSDRGECSLRERISPN